jgi:hypothetical protein
MHFIFSGFADHLFSDENEPSNNRPKVLWSGISSLRLRDLIMTTWKDDRKPPEQKKRPGSRDCGQRILSLGNSGPVYR